MTNKTDESNDNTVDTNQIIEERRQKLKALRMKGDAFPNDFTNHRMKH